MADEPTTTQGNGEGDPGADEGGQSPDTPKSKTFTQDQLDQIIADRLKREREKYGDYNDLKQKAAEFDKAEREKLSEIERLKLEKADAEKAVAEAQAQIAEAQKVAEQQMIYNQVLASIGDFRIKQDNQELSFRRDATAAILKLLDLEGVTVKDNSVEGVTQALERLASEYQFLLDRPRTPGGTSPVNPARTTHGPTDEELRQELFGNQRGGSFFQGGGLRKLTNVE